MRILYLNPVGFVGGGERVLLYTIKGVRKLCPQIQVHVLAFTDGPLVAEARQLGAVAEVLQMPRELARIGQSVFGAGRLMGGIRALPALRRYARQLRQAIDQSDPDLVHSNGIKSHLLLHLAGWNNGPRIWHIHDFLQSRPLTGRLLRWASAGSEAAVAVSQAVGNDAEKVLRNMPLAVISNGIDLEQFAPAICDGRKLDELAGMEAPVGRIVRVGLVATYARWKGQDVFLEAAAQALREQPNLPLRFYVIGSPIYHTEGSQFTRPQLQQQAAKLGITDRVGFIDFQNDTAAIYRALDVVVHASTRAEPFGLTIAEAMACGRAVIVAGSGGAAEMFCDGRDAIGVQMGNIMQLSLAIQRLTRDPGLRRRLARQARLTAAARFDYRRAAAQVLELYQKLQRPAAARGRAPAFLPSWKTALFQYSGRR